MTKSWKFRILFCLGLYFIIVGITAPIFLFPIPIPSPDLIYCFAVAWIVRRPDYVPTIAIIIAALTIELLLFNSPGLWSAFLLLMTEYFRMNATQIRILPFLNEWAIISLIYAIVQAAYLLILTILFEPSATIQAAILYLLATVIAYPIVVMLVNIIFKITKSRSRDFPIFRNSSTFGGTH